jgi:hypothetical protein
MNLHDLIVHIAKKENPTEKEYVLHQLFKRIVSEPSPIYLYPYTETIRISDPYISFVFLDTDSKPTTTNIHSRQSYSNIPFQPVKLNQRDLHIFHGDSSYSTAQREKPILPSFTLDTPTNIIDKAIPATAEPVSLSSMLDSTAKREKPAIRPFALNAPTSTVEKAFPAAEQPVSLASTLDSCAQSEQSAFRLFALDTSTSVVDKAIPIAVQSISLASMLDPNTQREQPTFRSFTLDTAKSIIDKIIPTAEQSISLNATHIRMQDKEVFTNLCDLENQFGQNIHNMTCEEQECDSYNLSLCITAPCCFDHHIVRHEAGYKILRFHRYKKIIPVAYLKSKPAM